MSVKKIYFISGLGADRRVFSFLDLSFCEPVYVDWIPPLKNETLAAYALRLRESIPEKEVHIVGISFGGMLATEMAKADPGIKAIILASNKTSAEFPRHLRIVKYFPFYNWLPANFLKRSAYIIKFIGGRNKKQQKRVILDIIRDTDMNFTRWAINAILAWKNEVIPSNIVHVHGTADRVLPYSLVKADYTIPGGSHVLPMDQCDEISALLKKLLS